MSNPLAAFLYVREIATEENAISLAEQIDSAVNHFVTDILDLEVSNEETIQKVYYNIGNQYFPGQLRIWFRFIYQAMIGEDSGPRLGLFTVMFTVPRVIARLQEVQVNAYS